MNSNLSTKTRRDLLVLAGRIVAAATLAAPAIKGNAQDGEYRSIAVKDGAIVSGLVKLAGAAPEPDRIIIGKDNHVCGHGHAAHDAVIAGAGGALAHAVVLLKGLNAGLAWDRGSAPKITQEKCAFHPYVQVARPHSTLTIHNKDPLLHNIHAYELIGRARRTLFNIAQPQAGQIDTHKLEPRRGNIIEIDCDAHNWMSAWVFVSEHPYAVVTDADGRFELRNVPAGNFELAAWHPMLGETTASISVKPKSKVAMDLAFSRQ